MKRFKSNLSFLMVIVMILSLQSTVFAAVEDTGFSDVSADAWYAGAVQYCVENGLMSGTGADKFSPDTPMSRAMLAIALYKLAGSPSVTETIGFTDVSQDTWYTDAVAWAVQNGIVSGYASGLFGTNDSVTREQIATILWRYTGSPAAYNTDLPFSDMGDISSYATTAVTWARGLGVISGKPGNFFDPKGNATRAEVAAIIWNYLTIKQSEPELQPTPTPATAPTTIPTPTPEPPEGGRMTNITVTVGNAVFSAKLYDNSAAREFLTRLPITLNMFELNGNEKYYYLPENLPADSLRVGSVKAGDLMLYGSDCLVLFYESFTTSYSYTKLGYIEDASGLAAAVGSGNVEVAFTKNN